MDIVVKQTVATQELYCLGDQELNILFNNSDNLRAVAYHIVHPFVIGMGMKLILSHKFAIAKDVKSFTNCCYVRCASISRGNAIHNNAQFRIPDKGHANKGLVVCYVVWVGSMKGMGLRTCARCT